MRDEKSSLPEECGENGGRKVRRAKEVVAVSARKLAAGLWRLQLPDVAGGGGGGERGGLKKSEDRVDSQVLYHSVLSFSRSIFLYFVWLWGK